jgi:methylated-DNA-[protein]-cysteine S-methyltransferase
MALIGLRLGGNPHDLSVIPIDMVGICGLAAGGKLGGFSAPGGTTTNVRQLDLER